MKTVKLQLYPDYCCGGGHCGPMPGYFYCCPYCKEEANPKTFDELKISQVLECDFCAGRIKVLKKYEDFLFEFEILYDK